MDLHAASKGPNHFSRCPLGPDGPPMSPEGLTKQGPRKRESTHLAPRDEHHTEIHHAERDEYFPKPGYTEEQPVFEPCRSHARQLPARRGVSLQLLAQTVAGHVHLR